MLFRSELVVQRISDTHSDLETRREMAKFVDVTNNPALDITREVCVVWKNGATRSIRSVPKMRAKAFQSLVDETWLNVHMQNWNRMAFLLGPVTVVPILREGKMTWQVLLPHMYDVVADPANPFGSPLAASWSIPSDGSGEPDTVVLDAEGWKYYKTGHGKPELKRVEEHGLDRFPGATLRMNVSYQDDWWGGEHNQRLVDGTVTIGVLGAALGFTRKAQSKKLLVALEIGRAHV